MNVVYSILQESSTPCKKIFHCSFDDIMKLINSMDKDDILKFSSGNFKDSPYSIYRNIKYSGKYGGFIECYNTSGRSAYVVIAVQKEARGKGLASQLVNQMIKEIDADTIIWRCSTENPASYKLAEKFGFKLTSESKNQKIYKLNK